MKALLRIVRLPNVITAASNSLAGAFCAGVSLNQWHTLSALALVSMSIYAAGILLNDLFDLEEDRRERPERPLPSGQVRVGTVAVLAAVLLAAGAAVAWSLGTRIGLTGSLLITSVIGYDAGLKRMALGPWVMGACRGLNFGIGVVAATSPDVSLIVSVISYAVYVAGITYVSRQETYFGNTKGLRAGFALIVAGILGVMAVILLKAGYRIDPRAFGIDAWRTILALALLVALTRLMSRRWAAAMTDPEPATIGGMVKTGVISLPLLDFAQTLALAGLPKAGLIVVLWLLARTTARKLYAT